MRRFHWMTLLSMLSLAVLLMAAIGSGQAQTKLAAADVTTLKALGSRSAPITIEVFSDFQCPACKRAFEETLRPVIDNYVTTGKVYLVHRDFPLSMHKYSREAARWANAAAQVGKFEKVEAALYAKQDTWSTNGNIELVVAAILSATELRKVRQLVQSGQLDGAIDRDVDLGKRRGVNQTPTLFVTKGGETEKLTSGVSYSLLKQYLNYLLQK